ncbi:MAG: 2OG-Fe(II) oxygenase [Alphaproteobacteria bacterium]|nr:2OG-Fe(II) oxygenase [Alphaproteobacteria bacterium]
MSENDPAPTGTIIDYAAIRAANLNHVPYDYMVGKGAVRETWVRAVRESFPEIKVTGFHPLSQMSIEGAFAKLIEEIEGPEFSVAVSEALGVDLSPYPKLITIRKISAAHEGNIHCDSESKIATLLIYMNEGWLSPEGRFRVLRSSSDFEDYAVEVSPEMGSFVAFRRTDHSWHGHTPFVGERRVVQVAWVRSQADVDRKTKRHKLSSWLKALLGEPSHAL